MNYVTSFVIALMLPFTTQSASYKPVYVMQEGNTESTCSTTRSAPPPLVSALDLPPITQPDESTSQRQLEARVEFLEKELQESNGIIHSLRQKILTKEYEINTLKAHRSLQNSALQLMRTTIQDKETEFGKLKAQSSMEVRLRDAEIARLKGLLGLKALADQPLVSPVPPPFEYPLSALGLAESAKGQYKTKLCRYFRSSSGCEYGNFCAYAHGKDELRQS